MKTQKPPLLCLILLISFPSVATVLISPALPQISDFFRVSNGYAQQLITLFVLGYAFGQLLYSPLANRFGRKPAIYFGISLYLVSCVICLAAIYYHAMHVLLVGRLLMALGASGGMTITFTIINDFYQPQDARRITSYTVLSYAFMPGLAIVVGGLITTSLSWLLCFYVLLVYGFVILWAGIKLPETLKNKNFNALKLKPLFTSYYHAFTCPRLLLFASIYGLMGAYIYIIASGAPFIAIDRLGMTSAHYGLALVIPYCGQFVGAIISGKLSKRISTFGVMALGYSAVTAGVVMMLLAFNDHWVSIISLMAPIALMMLGFPMTYSSSSVLALEHFPDKATGSAVMSFVVMSIILLGTVLFTLLPSNEVMIMPLCFLTLLILASASFITGYFIYKK